MLIIYNKNYKKNVFKDLTPKLLLRQFFLRGIVNNRELYVNKILAVWI